jgi:hypothetical protein
MVAPATRVQVNPQMETTRQQRAIRGFIVGFLVGAFMVFLLVVSLAMWAAWRYPIHAGDGKGHDRDVPWLEHVLWAVGPGIVAGAAAGSLTGLAVAFLRRRERKERPLKQASQRVRLCAILLSLSITALLTSCARTAPELATTERDFLDGVRNALDSGNVESLANCIVWGNTNEDYRKNTFRSFNGLAKSGKVSAMKCVPFDEKTAESVFDNATFPGKPNLWLHVDLKGDKFEGYIDFAVKKEGSRFRILAIQPPGKQT